MPRRGGVGEALRETRSRRRTGTTNRARTLRQGDNEAEALLWLDLKNSQLSGHKFTRQFPIGPYFADFCCRRSRLVVEIDGSQHAGSDYDRRRDAFMNEAGFAVLRVWHIDVLKERRAVLDTILAAIDRRLAPTQVAELTYKPADPLIKRQRVSHPS